ncbi:MAG TPA: class I SAM-dependent methyltransferase [Bacteroidota bacterium]|nr:class I SAM-dependent methyltransferase [Bacteroidota bacterium]
MDVSLGDVQKTLFLPLWGRAVETEKQHPLLVDKTAVSIVKKVNYDFSTVASNMHEITRYAWVVRSLLIDRVVHAYLEQHPDATVVNIGCGLDTTFERVDNGRCRWIDLDLPDVIALRRKFIAPSDRRQFLASSFLDSAWLAGMNDSRGMMFIAAGVFYYFEETAIKAFFRTLADTFRSCEVVCDLCSPFGVRAANKMVIHNSGLGEQSFLTWGIEKTADIESWDPRISIIRSYPYFRGMKRHLRPRYWHVAILSDLLRVQYLVHFRIANS